MRFGLVGTGSWARDTSAAALAATPGVELVGVWGRDPGRTADLAAHAGVRAFDDFDAMLATVDAVSFAVPPAVQAPLATRAAEAGKHLFLEKPIALTEQDSSALTAAVSRTGVATVVFFTRRFTPEGRQWLTAAQQSEWDFGTALWVAANFSPGSPFDTPWRREKGALWDVGPHAVALLVSALGPVIDVHADRGVRDLVHLTLRHRSGATSTATLTISAVPAAAQVSLELYGPAGRLGMPVKVTSSSVAAQAALEQLLAAAGGEVSESPCDVFLGRHVTEVLVKAEGA